MAELTLVGNEKAKENGKAKPEPLFKKACGCWAVVRRDFIPEHTKHGILLTPGGRSELKQEVATGTVLCVGDGSNPHLKGVAAQGPPCGGGDRIMWSRYGERILEEREDGDLVAIPFPEIIGVVC